MSSIFDSLLVHPQTETQLENFLSRPSHALLITGPAGAGKATLAKAFGAKLLGLDGISALEAYPFFFMLSRPTDKQEIPIDSVRSLTKSLGLKSAGRQSIRRLVLIEDANLLSREAQNALLKVLEEPAADVVFILTAPSKHSLLPTIVSRSQQIHIQSASLEAAKKFYSSKKTHLALDSHWLLSAGAAGLLHSLVYENEDHPMKKSVAKAKLWLTKDSFQRQLAINEIARSKQELINFLDALSRVLRAIQYQEIQKNHLRVVNKLVSSRQLITGVQEALEANVSTRLAIQYLLLNLTV